MPVLLILLGIVAALASGIVATMTAGLPIGVALFVLVIAAAVYGAWFAAAALRRFVLLGILAVAGVAILFGGYTAMRIANGLTGRGGGTDAADAAALASATKKVDDAKKSAAFRLELTDTELTAFVQDGLHSADTPVRSITLHLVAGTGGTPGALRFNADFKNGSLAARGTVAYAVDNGEVKATVQDVSLGAVTVPKLALSAMDDMIRQVADLNGSLREQRVTVQSLAITDGHMTMIGTSANGTFVTSQAVLNGFKARAQSVGTAKTAPVDKNGPGVVSGNQALGTPVYVALGDSLAAGDGVAQFRDSYASRFHNQLQKRDGKQYGFRGFGKSGETSGTMLRGQLDEALAFMKGADVAYVTIDIGANDLLAHLSTDDCANGSAAPACKARIDASLGTYRANLETILSRVQSAAPKAKVIFLQTYNPFSFGLAGVTFEEDSNKATAQLNGIAAEIAERHGGIIADGFTPMQGLATVATHMTEAPPNIHPLAIGYDILTSALLAAK